MEFESVLKGVGDFNRYQMLLLMLLNVIILINVCHTYIQVFTAGKNDHWCKAWEAEECPDSGFPDCDGLKKELAIPHEYLEDGSVEYEKCVKYNVSGISLGTAIELGENVSYLGKIPCDEGWAFDRTTFPSTINIDFELVCERSYLPNIGQSLFFAGYLVGSFLGGVAADIFGRRRCILACLAFIFALTAALTASPNVIFFVSLRFFVGVGLKACGVIDYVMLMETTSPTKRVFIGNAHFIFFGLGYFLLAGLAKLITGWRYLQLALTLPYIPLFIMAYMFILESPRWLSVKGRKEEARVVLRKIAAINNKTVDECSFDAMKEHEASEMPGMITNLRKIVRSPRLLLITLNMGFNWAVQSFVYYGLSFSTSSLGIDPYLSFIISGGIEIPAYLACMFVAEWLGRRGAVFTTMMLAGLCCSGSTLLPTGIYRALVATGGKFFITMSFSIVYTWSSELYPTSLRSTGVGLFSMTSRIGGILAPLVLLFEDIWLNLPYLLFGAVSILAALLALAIPETKGKPLPTTVRDTKNLYKQGREGNLDDADVPDVDQNVADTSTNQL